MEANVRDISEKLNKINQIFDNSKQATRQNPATSDPADAIEPPLTKQPVPNRGDLQSTIADKNKSTIADKNKGGNHDPFVPSVQDRRATAASKNIEFDPEILKQKSMFAAALQGPAQKYINNGNKGLAITTMTRNVLKKFPNMNPAVVINFASDAYEKKWADDEAAKRRANERFFKKQKELYKTTDQKNSSDKDKKITMKNLNQSSDDEIIGIYDKLLLSDVVYSPFKNIPDDKNISNNTAVKYMKKGGMSSSQIEYFSSRYDMIAFESIRNRNPFNGPIMDSQFIVVRDKDTNEYIATIRGSGETIDYTITDINIGKFGRTKDVPIIIKKLQEIQKKCLPPNTAFSEIIGFSMSANQAAEARIRRPDMFRHATLFNAPGFGGIVQETKKRAGKAPEAIYHPGITNIETSGRSFIEGYGTVFTDKRILIDIGNYELWQSRAAHQLATKFPPLTKALKNRKKSLTRSRNALDDQLADFDSAAVPSIQGQRDRTNKVIQGLVKK